MIMMIHSLSTCVFLCATEAEVDDRGVRYHRGFPVWKPSRFSRHMHVAPSGIPPMDLKHARSRSKWRRGQRLWQGPLVAYRDCRARRVAADRDTLRWHDGKSSLLCNILLTLHPACVNQSFLSILFLHFRVIDTSLSRVLVPCIHSPTQAVVLGSLENVLSFGSL